MKIKTWQERCKEHPDHNGIVSDGMILARMQEEIDDLRAVIEQAEKLQSNADHVVLEKGTNDCVCTHCGQRSHMRLPMPISVMTETIDTFIEAHRQCKKPRQWQGLTDEETAVIMVQELGVDEDIDALSCFARAVEAKLREKNT